MSYSDEQLVSDLRALMKSKKVSAKRLSRAIGVPYRSIQNYLGGISRIPATVLIDALAYIDADIRMLRYGDFLLRHSDLIDAIHRVFGDAISNIDLSKIGRKNDNPMGYTPTELAEHTRRVEIACELAIRLSEAYDVFARDNKFAGTMPTIKELRERDRVRSEGEPNSQGGEGEVGQ